MFRTGLSSIHFSHEWNSITKTCFRFLRSKLLANKKFWHFEWQFIAALGQSDRVAISAKFFKWHLGFQVARTMTYLWWLMKQNWFKSTQMWINWDVTNSEASYTRQQSRKNWLASQKSHFYVRIACFPPRWRHKAFQVFFVLIVWSGAKKMTLLHIGRRCFSSPGKTSRKSLQILAILNISWIFPRKL